MLVVFSTNVTTSEPAVLVTRVDTFERTRDIFERVDTRHYLAKFFEKGRVYDRPYAPALVDELVYISSDRWPK